MALATDRWILINIRETWSYFTWTIKPGDVTCVVEAMKLFNEIESEIKGTIIKVLVDDMSPVEYDQPLFLVDTH